MSAIGQKAVASWGNPLEAGTSPGYRPWGSYPKGGGVLHGGTSWGHLPAVVQAQQVAAAAAAAAAAVRRSGSNVALASAGGLSMGPAGCVAATAAEQQRQQQEQESHYGSDLPMSPTGSCASSNAPSTSLEDGPATISEAMAAMANAANMGGMHSGYSYTAAALHHANVQQHGNSPKHLPLPQEGGTMGAGQLPGGLSVAFGRNGSSGGGSAASAGVASPLRSAGSLGSQGIAVPPTIHEHLTAGKPKRVGSWGATTDIADSVSDFPASGSSVAAAAAAADAAAAAVAAAYHARRASSSPCPGKGLLVRLFDSKGMLDEAGNSLPTIPDSSSCDGSSRSAEAAAAARRAAQGNDSRRSSMSSNGAHAPSDVLGELDCCDASVITDIWSSLFPLATSALALQAASEGTQGLDFIAP